MLTSLAVLAGLLAQPAEVDTLSLVDARFTYGVFGPPRPNAKLLPGDHLVVAFDVAGITVDDAGKVRYSISTELSDAAGKVIHTQPAKPAESVANLGGGRLPAVAHVDVGLDQPAGEYKVKVTVVD